MPPHAGNTPAQTELQQLERALKVLVDGSDAFRNEVAVDLGKHTFGRLVGFSLEGLQLAYDGVQARMRHCDVAQGCVPAVCAIFDGLRIARRGAALTLIESQDATVLTAKGIQALKELCRQVEACIGMAQHEFGAAVSLRNAAETLRTSGLDGIDGMVGTLESAAEVATGITHDLEDKAAIRVAGRMRRLEVEVRPLVDAMDPMLTKAWDKVEGEILWETRMVNVNDIVTEALRDVRAEVGGWAICADVAAELRGCTEPAAVSVAAGFDLASKMLRDEGVQRRGTESLHAVRQVVVASAASSLPEATVLLLRDAPRWLRESVGAAAVLREAAAHRIPAALSVSANAGEESTASSAGLTPAAAAKVQQAVEAAAERLASTGKQSGATDQPSRDTYTAAAAEFRRAVTLAREQESLHKLFNEVDKDIAHLLGVAWSAELVNAEPGTGKLDVEDVMLEAPPNAAAGGATAGNEDGKAAAGGCCTVS